MRRRRRYYLRDDLTLFFVKRELLRQIESGVAFSTSSLISQLSLEPTALLKLEQAELNGFVPHPEELASTKRFITGMYGVKFPRRRSSHPHP